MTSDDIALDKTPLTFGKYRGLSPDEISETDPGYIVWMYNTVKPKKCSNWLASVCKDEIDPLGGCDATESDIY